MAGRGIVTQPESDAAGRGPADRGPADRAAADRAAAEFVATAQFRSASGTAEPAPVLLLHGLGGESGQLWDEADGYPGRRWAPDLRAHGRTALIGGDECFTFAQFATDVSALLGRWEAQPVLVVGVSMGAGVALSLTLAHPEQVRALLLIRPAWGTELPPANLMPLQRAGEYLQRWGPVAGRARFVETPEYAAVAAHSAAAAASLLGQFDDPDARARSVRLRRMPLSRPWSESPALTALSTPVEVVGALDDPVHPFELAEFWTDAIPGAALSALRSRDADPAGYRADLRACVQDFLQRWG